MTQEQRQEILKNSLVLKAQKDPDWARDIENSIERELVIVLKNWLDAATHEHIGPREVLRYLGQIQEKMKEASCYLEDGFPEDDENS